MTSNYKLRQLASKSSSRGVKQSCILHVDDPTVALYLPPSLTPRAPSGRVPECSHAERKSNG